MILNFDETDILFVVVEPLRRHPPTTRDGKAACFRGGENRWTCTNRAWNLIRSASLFEFRHSLFEFRHVHETTRPGNAQSVGERMCMGEELGRGYVKNGQMLRRGNP